MFCRVKWTVLRPLHLTSRWLVHLGIRHLLKQLFWSSKETVKGLPSAIVILIPQSKAFEAVRNHSPGTDKCLKDLEVAELGEGPQYGLTTAGAPKEYDHLRC